ncbi:MAG: class I SAM-dependent methyltransferase [Bacteroidetes bacterium QH_2_67_10]|nr:MAG: class I SAM-dependent methyltransferase [Bacteroidetes bacterium QH_2_67_10]
MSLYQRYFAALMRLADGAQERHYGERKERLFDSIAPGDRVVEIGPGTGVNLAHLPPGVRYVGVEPNPHMHAPLLRKADALDLASVELHEARAEALPLPDEHADAVLSTLVLCSVDRPQQALAEVRRVLRPERQRGADRSSPREGSAPGGRPGGRFYFIEHVAASEESTRRRVQRFIKPAWRPLADGCRPDQCTGALIERAGFAEVQIDRFLSGSVLNPIRPHVAGVARR